MVDDEPTKTEASNHVDSLRVGLKKGLLATLLLAKVMIPVYVIVDLLHNMGAVEALAEKVAPFMGLFGLLAVFVLWLFGLQ